ncbi:MAG: phosphomannomutase/phosphoglucomutase [Clostridiales bacterium]|nr:phosphomannomutase/phosphoglucomutase [Clostridiales bacterium]
MVDYMKLQNGSDIRGVAMKAAEGDTVELTEELAGTVGGAFAYWLGFKVGKNPYDLRICVGHDSRVSADELTRGLIKGMTMFGAEVWDAGLATTPAMFMSTVMPQFDFDGAVMVTASHLPWNRNGFKFFSKEGGLEKEDIASILRTASRYAFVGEYYEERKANVLEMYAAYLRQMISMGLKDVPGALKGMHIVVDAGNGASGFYASEVLERMGADISGSRFLEPDGMFPNHKPNPEDPEAMASICEAVLENGADLGIIFDADGDRVSAVGPDGKPISRNGIIALAAALAADDYPGGTVVTDSVTSDELKEFLEKDLGLKHLRYKRGYRNVINKAKELNESGEKAFLAIETSGHAAYSDNYYLDDGAFLATQIVINAARLKSRGKDITALTESLKHPAESWEIRFNLTVPDYAELGTRIIEDMKVWAAETEGMELVEPNYEGVRVNYDVDGSKGWFLLRMSLHDPILPLNIESSEKGGIAKVIPLIGNFLNNYDGIEMPQ